jgi:DNA-binding MarR family transcriptional regulator
VTVLSGQAASGNAGGLDRVAAAPVPSGSSMAISVQPHLDVARLRVAILRLSRRLRKHELAGLTPSQLSALSTVGHIGPLRLGDLAAAERIAPSTLTRLVSALEKCGYIERCVVRDDARASMVSITELGRSALGRIREETTNFLATSLLQFPPDQLAALAAALPAIERLAESNARDR